MSEDATVTMSYLFDFENHCLAEITNVSPLPSGAFKENSRRWTKCDEGSTRKCFALTPGIVAFKTSSNPCRCQLLKTLIGSNSIFRSCSQNARKVLRVEKPEAVREKEDGYLARLFEALLTDLVLLQTARASLLLLRYQALIIVKNRF